MLVNVVYGCPKHLSKLTNESVINTEPMVVKTIGGSHKSQISPNTGAKTAYVAPLITNINPIISGFVINCRICGSSVACMYPMVIEAQRMLFRI